MTMSTLSAYDSARLAGRALYLPDLHTEPMPIRRVEPSPCTQACPAGVAVKAYVSLIAEERFEEALEVVSRRCPLPGVCGRVCHHPCEDVCRRGGHDEAVAIRELKRFVADVGLESSPPVRRVPADRRTRIAVIGAGPAGLTAALDLRNQGFPVTVFESAPEPGGMLRYGITAYRLPRDILDHEIERFVRAGVEIRTGERLGEALDFEGLLGQGYSAVLLAVGAQRGKMLDLFDSCGSCDEVQDALTFLRRVNEGSHESPGRRVVVIGGGSTAVEAARTALRLGANSVKVIYRRYREEMLCSQYEIEAAEREGVDFQFLVAPLWAEMEGGALTGLECIKIGLREPDASGRRRPIQIPGSEFTLDVDCVLLAVGQDADLSFLHHGSRQALADGSRLAVDDHTAMTSLKGVFAAGDVVSGPATVIEAIAAGHAAAESIRHFLDEGRPGIREQKVEGSAAAELELPDAPPLEAQRIRPHMMVPGRGQEFEEVEHCFTAADAIAEAQRCLRCGPCGECRTCASSCNRRHVVIKTPEPTARSTEQPAVTALVRAPSVMALSLPDDRPAEGWLLPEGAEGHRGPIDTRSAHGVEVLPVRTRIESTLCRSCGLCVDICPFDAARPGAVDTDGSVAPTRIDAAACRGCNLCSAICPTEAASSTTLSPEWWGRRLEDATHLAACRTPPATPYVVLACQRRAGALEGAFDRTGVHVELIRFRCVGQVESGMLLEFLSHGVERILVAGCTTDRCRFGQGAFQAVRAAEDAAASLRLLGRDPSAIAHDWSPSRAFDRLDDVVARFVRGKEGRDA